MRLVVVLALLGAGCFDYDARLITIDGPTLPHDASTPPGVDGAAGFDASVDADASSSIAPTLAGSSTAVAETPTTLTVQYPNGGQTGDLVVLAGWFLQTLVEPPSGFTVLTMPSDSTVSGTSAFIAYKTETLEEQQGGDVITVTLPTADQHPQALYAFAIHNAHAIELVGVPTTYPGLLQGGGVDVSPSANGATQAVVIMGMYGTPSCMFNDIKGFSPAVGTFNLELYIDESADTLSIDELCQHPLMSYVVTVVSLS